MTEVAAASVGEVHVERRDLRQGALGLPGAIMQNITHIAPAVAAFFFTQFVATFTMRSKRERQFEFGKKSTLS